MSATPLAAAAPTESPVAAAARSARQEELSAACLDAARAVRSDHSATVAAVCGGVGRALVGAGIPVRGVRPFGSAVSGLAVSDPPV